MDLNLSGLEPELRPRPNLLYLPRSPTPSSTAGRPSLSVERAYGGGRVESVQPGLGQSRPWPKPIDRPLKQEVRERNGRKGKLINNVSMLIVNEDSVKSITLEKYLSPSGLEPVINTLKYQRKPVKTPQGGLPIQTRIKKHGIRTQYNNQK